MGEAKRRRAMNAGATEAKAQWAAGLSDRDKTVLRVAERLGSALVDWGACYRYTMFLKYHLEIHHGIQGEAVVGFINDGTDDVYGGHAWYELDGLITDIALCRPMDTRIQKAGHVTILGREMAPGWHYTYHRSRPPEGVADIERQLRDPMTQAAVAEHEALYAYMLEAAQSNDRIRAYLDGAPDGRDYKSIARAVER
jgi:hypothetical protein